MTDFVHLRVHSDYSLSEGASSITALAARAKELSMPALALTDKDSMYGVWKASEAIAKAGVQPVIGVHLYISLERGGRGNVLLLAQTDLGYRNICALLRAACDPSPGADGTMEVPEQPELDPDLLAAHAADVILLTGGGKDGFLPQIAARDPDAAREVYFWLLSAFCDRLYVEICRDGEEAPLTTPAGPGAPAEVEATLIALAHGAAGPVECADGVRRAEAPLVATTDIWYATPDRHDSWLLLGAISEKRVLTIDGDQIVDASPARHHMRGPAEMASLFADLPEALENTVNIARRCAFVAMPRKPILPKFACEGGRGEDEEIAHQARAGLEARLDRKSIDEPSRAIYRDRLEFEIGVINAMGFPGYFLIVSDFIKWAKSNDIPVGPGRGSGAGSVVAWSLMITDLDPLTFGLLFERFLNPERVSMPDFDIDFCETRRDEVIGYVKQKYGADRVAMIATFTVIKAKTAIRDAARSIFHEQHRKFGFQDVNEFCKLMPDNPADPKTLSQACEEVPELRRRIEESPKVRMIYERALGIEGLHRQASQHAAGIVIGDRPLQDLLPVVWAAKPDMPVCAFDMKGAEASGLVKFDFLGLKTLSVIHLALSYIREFRGLNIDLADIPIDDAQVFARLAEGQTTAVFQLEGGGMRRALRQIKPTRLEDITAVNALYRPGPMENIPEYAERKHGKPWQAPHPSIQDILGETYGIMVYQEQVMQIAQTMAGYSLASADLLRRAMGKKIREEMEQQRDIFTRGAVGRGIPSAKATEVFDLMAKFADYGFNKSHAAAYAWIAYQTAWLKVHYPAEFLSAAMSFEADDPDKLALIKDELDDLRIPLRAPDINFSHMRFRPEADAASPSGFSVRFGLAAIKQISGTQSGFLEERSANGPFTSLEDFHRRAGMIFNKAQIERLAEAGAFTAAGLGRNRRQSASVLTWLSQRKTKTPKTQTDMFGASALTVPPEILDEEEWGDITDREFKAVGFYFSHHPIDVYVSRLKRANVKRRQSYAAFMLANHEASLDNRRVCVMVDDIKMVQSARGNSYVRAFVSERGDSYQISCFDNPRGNFGVADFQRVLQGAKAIRRPVVFMVSLTLDRTGEGVWVNGRGVWPVDEYLAGVRGDLTIRLAANAVRPRRDEIAALKAAPDEAARDRVRSAVLARRVDDLAAIIVAGAGAGRVIDTNPNAGTPVRIVTQDGVRVLPGRYDFAKNIEAIVQTFDGVISVREEFEDAGPSSTPLRMAS